MAKLLTTTFDTETWELGTRGNRGAFTGLPYIRDLRLYADGSLGPRPRWRPWAEGTSNFATPFQNAFATQDPTTRVIYRMQAREDYFAAPYVGWVVVEQDSPTTSRARFITIVTNTIAIQTATLSASVVRTFGPAQWVHPIGPFEAVIDNFHINLDSGSLIVTDIEGPVDTTFSGSLGFIFRGSCVHQGRCFVWGAMLDGSDLPSNENRIYYSDPYAYTTFTSATQFFDIDGPVAGCASIGSSLLIWSDDGEWFILQGRGNPAEGTLNKLGRGRIPERTVQPAKLDNVILFRSSDHTALVVVGEDGILDDKTLEHLGLNTEAAEYYGVFNTPNPVANSLTNSVLVPKFGVSTGCLHNARNVWTDEVWGVDLKTDHRVQTADLESKELLILYDSADQDAAYFYERDVLLGSPEQETAYTWSESPTGVLGLPRIFVPGSSLRMESVVVEGRYWQGADYRTVGMTCSVSDGRGDSTACTAVGSPTDTPTTLDDATGDSYRFTFRPNAPMANTSHIDVELSAIAGLTVERVHVVYEKSEQSLLV